MTIDDALEKIIVSAHQFGYTDKAIAAFLPEIREELYFYDDLTEEVVQDMIEEIF